MAEIKVPTLGESVTEATVAKWLKQVGDEVAIDEPLVELETDKVTLEVPASSAGTLSEIVAAEGVTVEVGGVLGRIGDGVLDRSGPAARKAVAETGIDPATIKGSGKDGRITKGDVLAAAETKPAQ